MSFLILSRLRKTYPDGTEAVKSLDLTVEPGEFIVLLGPSGCGKTTTLRMVAGLEPPSGGCITLNGRDVTALRPARRDVGFVFQFYALYPHMTVRENIAFPLENTGVPPDERTRALTDIARRLDLGALLDLRPAQLSGGDQQRVALARAMVRRPSLYLMDEPLGTLDADRRLELREIIRSQQLDLAVTTLYVTHDQEEAMSLADRIIVMDAGEIRQTGPPVEIYDTPATLFVANFVGSPGMNLVTGEIRRTGAGLLFTPETGACSIPLARNVRPGPAVLGIRPEHIHPAEAGPISAAVHISEYLGGHRIVHLETPLGPLRMRASSGTPIEGRLSVRLDDTHTCLFDLHTGRKLPFSA